MEYEQKRITREKSVRAYQETGIKPISGTPGLVVDGRVTDGCLTGVVGIHDGLICVPDGTGELFSLVPEHRKEMNCVYGKSYLDALEIGFDHAKTDLPYDCRYGWDRLGYKDGYESGQHIRRHGIPPLEVPDFAPLHEEELATA